MAAMADSAFDLSKTYVHLGLGARATPIPDFQWSEAFLERYETEHAADGDEGRLVLIGHEDSTWTSWERHPAGDELVVLLSGLLTLVQDLDGSGRRLSCMRDRRPLILGTCGIQPIFGNHVPRCL